MGHLLICLLGCVAASAGPGTVARTVGVGTDVAGLFLFHPDDLKHRLTSPREWVYTDFSCGAEFAAGTFIAWDTGGDGGFDVRVTDGDLTPREKGKAGGWYDFRYRVRHGRVLVDGGLFLPSDDPDRDKIPDDHWVTMPDGDYQVRVTSIDWSDDKGAPRLPSYVARFRRVKRLDETPILAPTPPRVEGPPEPSKEPPSYLHYEEDLSHPLNESYPAMVSSPAFVLPRDSEYRDVPRPLHDALRARVEFGVRKASLVLLDAEAAPTIGTLVAVDIVNGKGDDRRDIRVGGVRLVRVTETWRRGPILRAEVAPLTRSRSKVSARDMAEIKAEFAAFARVDPGYRKAIRNPDFEAERVAAVGSPSALTNILLHHIPLTAQRRQALLPLSDLERIRGIRAVLGGHP